MEQYASIQQLKKKEEGQTERMPIYPPTVVQAVFDAKTGASLEVILSQFNAIYVQYQGTPEATRNIIPQEMRRAGLTITYMNMESETITERASSAVQKDNDHWGLDVNWSRVDELSLSGDIAVSANGTWIINDEDTGIPARGSKGDTGLTPWLKTIDNKLHYSYDNETWEPCSENIAAWFRFNATSSDSQAGTIGKIQISRDNKTWKDLSPEFTNNLRIKSYVSTTSALPTGQAVGTIYGVGPTYDSTDTEQTNPIYRLYVYNGSSWVDNGRFTSIAAGVVQEAGDSETEVMSQKATTKKLTELTSQVVFKSLSKNLFNKESKDNVTGYYIGVYGNLAANNSYTVSHYIPVEETKNYYQRFGTSNTYWALFDSAKNFIVSGLTNEIPATSGAAYLRITSRNDQVATEQVEEGSAFTSYESYAELVNRISTSDLQNKSITNDKLADKSVSTDKIENNAVTEDKTIFFEVINLVNKNDDNVVYGAYVGMYGDTPENSAYNVTGYIPVQSGKTYRIGSLEGSKSEARTISFYDSNKKVLSALYLQDTGTFVVEEGVAYLRASLYANDWEYAQITEGEEQLSYIEYKKTIKKEYLPAETSGGNNSDSDNTSESLPDFYLPKNIYVAAGRTIELYYDEILINAHKYNIQAKCDIGKALERKFQIIGDSDKIGTYTLTINVYNDAAKLIYSDTSTIHIVLSAIESQINVLPIGDSLTNGKAWLTELGTLSESMIKTVGTRSNKHEGRSGANVSTYTSVSGAKLYSFDNFYTGAGVDATVFDESTDYAKGTLVRRSTTFGNGSTGHDVYVFIADHSAGSWNEDEVYCISGGNPFYDYNNAKFSIDFYKSLHGISYDVIMIYLGTNGISLTPETNANGALGIQNLINLIREEDSTTPIVVVNTIFRSGQNGIGNQGNTDGYSAQAAYKFEEDRKVLLLGKALEDMVGDMDNVYLCPVGFTHDSKYNFGNSKIAVNPRLTDVTDVYELQPLDSVHPQNCGYYQMADEMFSTICAILK